MAYDVSKLLKMSQAEIEQLFAGSPPGPIPNGEAKGTAIVDPGTVRSVEVAEFLNHFVWQGKVFDAKSKTLVNHIGPFGLKAILAEIYIDKSLIDQKDCVVLDYSKTSLVAKHIRDEIRQIAPTTYLGPVYWDGKTLFFFALQFKR